ncbi:MAG TPA: ArsB/NhaD family transporter [Candidatus Limnocylindria bacterium]|nr:ArsB/NhaD family transporter [Candidatus Limnocylindria bacterium]
MSEAHVAVVIFVITYVLIVSERVHKTTAALAGAMAVILLKVLDAEEAWEAIDLNVIFLLAGMMIIAGGLSRTGFFEYVAGRAIQASKGDPYRLLIFLAILTAILAAVLDNVTTVVLLTPVTLSLARTLRVSPFPYLLSQIFASNIGGTATLIGDPPNILIGSAAGLDFVAFLVNLAPVVVVIMVIFVFMMRRSFRGSIQDDSSRLDRLAELDPAASIKDPKLMVRSLIVLGLTIVGFLFHTALGLEAATIAMLGATVLMLVGPLDPHDTLREIEWNTLFFFVGLFMLIEAVVHVGLVGGVATALAEAADGRLEVATMGILWFSAIASAVVDNIPYTATAIPIVQGLIDSGIGGEVLWWALALGACLGGNLTIVGASANIVVANLAARDGHPITFWQFFRYGFGVVVMSLTVSTVYLWVRYLT